MPIKELLRRYDYIAYAALIGRVCFALPIFLGSAFQPDVSRDGPHWQGQLIQVVKIAVLVLSTFVLAGMRARKSAAVITVILVVGSLMGQSFRFVDGPMLGGAMIIGYFGSGPYSLDRQLSRWVSAFFHVRYSDIIEWRATQSSKRPPKAQSSQKKMAGSTPT
jgi:hypothetical protein